MSYFYGGVNDNEDYNDEEEQNDLPPDDLDPTFCNNVQRLKWNIYQNTVLKPELDTPATQDNMLLKKYLNCVRKMYLLSLDAQKGKNKNVNLKEFPKEVQGEIQELLDWIADFFKKNQLYQTIPYSDYLLISFQVYPFIQRKTFNNESFVDMD